MSQNTLQAFTPEEYHKAHVLLALRVAHMMGRKLEEDDWSSVYCRAKGIPNQGWSNLNIDVVHNSLGVEHKMLCYRSKPTLDQAYGTTLMHPSLTRSVRIHSLEASPEEVMHDVFRQYAELVESRRQYVADQGHVSPEDVDLRTGWLLWQTSLRQFLYFEERTSAPSPEDYTAQWNEQVGLGRRKGSKNLWIYERNSGKKRYSVTTSAGIKIQPYFDVPPPADPNVYLFTVIGERLEPGIVRVGITRRTAHALERTLGNLERQSLSRAILEAIDGIEDLESTEVQGEDYEELIFLTISEEAYIALCEAFPGVNDEHCFQLFVDLLNS
jgi:hypothetical protein